jgi:hypothetical protein
MKSKVGISSEKVEYARSLARNIAKDVQDFVDNYTTVAVLVTPTILTKKNMAAATLVAADVPQDAKPLPESSRVQ